MMKESVPGCLYAKSLKAGDPPGEGYQTWFLHADLVKHEAKIAELRNQFHWVTDSGRQHPPVVVAEPASEAGQVLVVRFSDAGKDPFGRSQTLRMEAMLVAAADLGQYWNGAFKTEPDKEEACFLVETGGTGGRFSEDGGQRLVLGDPRTFTLGKTFGRVGTTAGGSGPGKANAGGGNATQTPPVPAAPGTKTEPANVGGKRLNPFWALALAGLLGSAAWNAIQYREAGKLQNEAAAQREQLEPLIAQEQALSERERQLAERETEIKAQEDLWTAWLQQMPTANTLDDSPPE